MLFGGPIVSTSANLHGMAPARTATEVLSQLQGEILAAVVDSEVGGLQHPTTIRDARTGVYIRH
jgi:L-threonylcarbamoyladenylate synthase